MLSSAAGGAFITVDGILPLVYDQFGLTELTSDVFEESAGQMHPSCFASVVGLTDNPTHGLSAEDGVVLSAVVSGFTGAPPAVIQYQWSTVEAGAIPGATGENFVPDAAVYDGQSLYCTLAAAPYPPKDTATATIRNAPPVSGCLLADEILDLGSGTFSVDAGQDFTGEALQFSVTGPGCTIDAQSGLLSISTDAPVAGAIVSVAALNSGGRAVSTFQLTVEELGGGLGPELSAPLLDEATNTISLNVSEDSTIYWRRDPIGTNPDAAQVIAGGGYDSGSFPVSAGQNNIDIAFSPGNDGLQSLSLVAAIVPTEPSLVRTVPIDIDTDPPSLVSSTPEAGAAGVVVDANPTLVFDEDIAPGQGVVTLWNASTASVEQAFDVVAGLGTGPGQMEIVGNVLTLRPWQALAAGKHFAVLIDPGAIRDVAGNNHPGISDPTALSFSTTAESSPKTSTVSMLRR